MSDWNRKIIDSDLFQIKDQSGTVRFTALFIPVLLQYLLMNLLGTVNTAVLSNVSENAVGAVGSANQMITMFNIMTTVICTGASSVVNNYLGAKKQTEVKEASGVAIAFCCMIGLVIGILLAVFRYPAISLMNLSGEILEFAVVYFAIRSAFLVIFVATQAINTIMCCYGKAAPGVIAGIISNAVNLLGTYVAVHTLSKDPHRMIVGVGAACVISQFAGLIFILIMLRRSKIPLGWPQKAATLYDVIRKILKVGLPGGVSSIAFNVTQTMTTSFVALLGDVALNGKVYFTTTASYCYMLSFAMGNAAAILVGRYAGAGRYEETERFCRQVWRIAAVLNLLSSLLLLTFRYQILGLFTKQQEILAVSGIIFAVDILAEQSRAVSHIYEKALVAAGDSFFCMPIIIASGLINGVGLAYLLGIPFGMGLPGVWIGFVVDEFVRAVVTRWRWASGKWMTKSKRLIGQ